MKRLPPNERRAQILNVALELATESGYHKLTRHTVATNANVSLALVTHYFPSDTLGAAVMREAVRTENLSIIAQGLACRDPIARRAPVELRRKAAAALR